MGVSGESTGGQCYPLRAGCSSALSLLGAGLGQVEATQQVVPPAASVLRAADVSQADLGPRLRRTRVTDPVSSTGFHRPQNPRAETDHTVLEAGPAGVADVHPQRFMPQCTMGYLHAEHLVDLHGVLRRRAARPEEAAGGLRARQHRQADVPAGDRAPPCLSRRFPPFVCK